MTEAKTRLPPFAALRAFHAAAMHAPLPRRRASLGITESAISHQVRRLETFLRIALFDRSGPGARLTPAGQRYLEQVEPAIRQLQAATLAILGPAGRNVVAPDLAALAGGGVADPAAERLRAACTRASTCSWCRPPGSSTSGATRSIWRSATAKARGPRSTPPSFCRRPPCPSARPAISSSAPATTRCRRCTRRLIVNARFPNEWEEWARAPRPRAAVARRRRRARGHGGDAAGRRERPRRRHRPPAHGRRPPGARHARGAVRRRQPDRRGLLPVPAVELLPTAVARGLERWLQALAAAT